MGGNDLGSGKIGSLMLRMSIPTIAAQLVNALYNVVDRIYIGHIPEEGELALAGAKVGIASMGLNPVALNDVSGVLNKGTVGPQKFRNDLIHVIQQYKDEIRAKNKKFKGFIFFIDDMDRLEPVVAVQILSLLKNLFDVPDCVFVLAIDYEVVVKGLEKKFGKPSDTVFGQTNNREFRSYFDKIIQLTFRVPTDQLDLNQYLRELLGRINFCGLRLLKNEKFIGNFSK